MKFISVVLVLVALASINYFVGGYASEPLTKEEAAWQKLMEDESGSGGSETFVPED